jgi:hypothetical protein
LLIAIAQRAVSDVRYCSHPAQSGILLRHSVHGVMRTNRIQKTCGYLLQDVITRLMTMDVVDLFKMINIAEQQ